MRSTRSNSAVATIRDYLARTHNRFIVGIVAALGLYVIGWEWPLLLIVIVGLAIYLPLPTVFSSWLGRTFVSLLFVYSLVQIAALAQTYVYPSGKFVLVATLLAAIAAGLVWFFGNRSSFREPVKLPLFNLKDVGVALGCAIFIVPFAILNASGSSFYGLTQVAGIQISDSIVHYRSIDRHAESQTLRTTYTPGNYYPSGFHIASSFVQHAVVGSLSERSWTANATTYFVQYILSGLLLGAAAIYLCFSFLEAFGRRVSRLLQMSLAVAVGVSMALLYLWLFVELGFMNYFYICIALLVALCYLIEKPLQYERKKRAMAQLGGYIWPISAFLLITFGASFSWPLFAPVVLLIAGLAAVTPLKVADIRSRPRTLLAALVPILLLGGLHLVTLCLQMFYQQDSEESLLLHGAISNFNILLLILGVFVALVIIVKNVNNTAGRLTTILLPYIVLTGGLMAFQFFLLGEARYYLIKTAYVLGIILLVLFVAFLVRLLQAVAMHTLLKALAIAVLVPFVAIATMGSVPQPFQEIRSLFRGYSHTDLPPFFNDDAKLIASLGTQGRLHDYNMTVLHYDAADSRLFAHAETAEWANNIAPKVDATLRGPRFVTGGFRLCAGDEFDYLAYGTNDAVQQGVIRDAVKACIAHTLSRGSKYYIVTDSGSVPALKQLFGEGPVYATP